MSTYGWKVGLGCLLCVALVAACSACGKPYCIPLRCVHHHTSDECGSLFSRACQQQAGYSEAVSSIRRVLIRHTLQVPSFGHGPLGVCHRHALGYHSKRAQAVDCEFRPHRSNDTHNKPTHSHQMRRGFRQQVPNCLAVSYAQ